MGITMPLRRSRPPAPRNCTALAASSMMSDSHDSPQPIDDVDAPFDQPRIVGLEKRLRQQFDIVEHSVARPSDFFTEEPRIDVVL